MGFRRRIWAGNDEIRCCGASVTESGSGGVPAATDIGHLTHYHFGLLCKFLTGPKWGNAAAEICWQAIFERCATRRRRATGVEVPRLRTADRPSRHQSSATAAPDVPIALSNNSFDIRRADEAACRTCRAPTSSQRIPRTRATVARNAAEIAVPRASNPSEVATEHPPRATQLLCGNTYFSTVRPMKVRLSSRGDPCV